MLILALSLMFPSWKWSAPMTTQYAYMEVLFIDLPLVAWGTGMVIHFSGVLK